MADKEVLKDLLEDEIKDLYSAEKQLTKAIPKMAKGANDTALQDAFKGHLKETEAQVQRLEQIAGILEMKPSGKKCVGMEGCIEEGAEALSDDGDETVLDLGIIGAGSRVEHYEMAGYGSARDFANTLGLSEVAALLEETLEEEKQADKKLTSISKQVNSTAKQAA